MAAIQSQVVGWRLQDLVQKERRGQPRNDIPSSLKKVPLQFRSLEHYTSVYR
jgi:hypothetical protein